jgi:sn-glycerol 3-phosphate transport system permease protein
MLNSYSGLIIPLIASATATFLFRQFFLTIPDELGGGRAHRPRGADPVLLRHPAAAVRTNIAALFIILFIYGWNQYLWPFLITTDTGPLHHRHGHPAHGECGRRHCRSGT